MNPCNDEYDPELRRGLLDLYGSKLRVIVNNSKNFMDNGRLLNPEFLDFPDWKKIFYKKKYNKFLDHPLQTLDQGSRRQKVLIYLLNYLYGGNMSLDIPYEGSYRSFGGLPKQLGKIFTPKLLEVYPLEQLIKYMNCTCCCYLNCNNGELKELRRHEKSKVVLFKKVCDILKLGNSPPHIYLNGKMDRCPHFDWMPFYIDLIKHQIIKYFSNVSNKYNPEDYINDLDVIDLNLYFRNGYDNLINFGV